MDQSKEYIKMCKLAFELQIDKEKQGYEPGDFIICSNDEIFVYGNNLFRIHKAAINTLKQHRYYFKLHSYSPSVYINFNKDESSTDVKINDIIIKKVIFFPFVPILFRQDQIQKLVSGFSITQYIHSFSEFLYNKSFFLNKNDSLEKHWLAWAMYQKNWEIIEK